MTGTAAIEPLCVTGIGAVSAVGFDAPTACASIRAGITRPAAIPGLIDVDPESQEMEAVHGHPVGTLGDGFTGPARWLQLLEPCLLDLCHNGALPPWEDQVFWGGTVVFVITPYLDSERYHPNPRCTPDAIHAALIVPLRRLLGDRFQPRSIQVLPRGRIGVFEVVAQFQRMRQTSGFERALVVAVDSWLDGHSLSYLMTMRRLKNNANPVGLSPGEGAFAVLLEPHRSAQHRQAGLGPVIRRSSYGAELSCLLADERSDGIGLAAQVLRVLRGVTPSLPYPTHILDLNGESWRAAEWGGAMVRLQSGGLELADGRQWLPALSVGEVGAGASILGMVIAARAFARNYAGGPAVLLSSSDEHGDVGAMLLEKE
ncbi:MAG: hypothetical protein AB1Z98_30450 [Nannocystaceae bacterium]